MIMWWLWDSALNEMPKKLRIAIGITMLAAVFVFAGFLALAVFFNWP